MRLVEDLGKNNAQYLIITGDGRTELKVLRALSKKYNGKDLILFFPFPPRSRKTGLSALNSLKTYPNIGINSFIFIVDGDNFEEVSADTKIQEHLTSIGIEVVKIILIQESLLINCKLGNKNIVLYCIISGPQTFIEEEIVKLIELKLGKKIDLSGKRDIDWKERVKKEVIKILRDNKIKLEELIRNTGKKKLELSFPNFCAVLKEIEENFTKSSLS